MKTSYRLFLAAWLGLAQAAGAIPSEITYQGTLKQKNLPANGVYNLLFRVTNQDGTLVYWSSGNQTITVTNGLFSARLSPSGVDWQNVIPYIEVSVEGQLLNPREPINATVYAALSESVVDGAISTSKLDSSVQQFLVPSGAVMLFAGPCPAYWTRFTALDNNFPLGSTDYGTTGGSATHTHSTGGATSQASGVVFSGGQGSGSFLSDWGRANHSHSVSAASNLPPYVSVVYCQKN